MKRSVKLIVLAAVAAAFGAPVAHADVYANPMKSAPLASSDPMKSAPWAWRDPMKSGSWANSDPMKSSPWASRNPMKSSPWKVGPWRVAPWGSRGCSLRIGI
jgi:hypothetical protein